jgi:hypothetical protein
VPTSLDRDIAALEFILQEIRHFYAITADWETSADLRQRDAEVSERLEILRAKRDRARARSVSSRLTAKQKADRIAALEQLDRYVRNDRDVHRCVVYLLEITALIQKRS